jgi:predicted transcriptional regulator
MSSPPVALDVGESVHGALTLSSERGIHHFPLLRAGQIVGFVCTCDLEGAGLNDTLESCMRTDVVTVPPEATTRAAAQLMVERGVGSLLVLDGDAVRGIVTREDLRKDGSANGGLVEKVHCHSCHRRHRLLRTSAGEYECVECAGTQQPPHFETGFGD